MYNERVRLEFREDVAPSARLRFLAELAKKLELAGRQSPVSPGFSIELSTKGNVTIDIWQPGKAEVLFDELRSAESLELLNVTSQK